MPAQHRVLGARTGPDPGAPRDSRVAERPTERRDEGQPDGRRSTDRYLPLEARPERSSRGWVIRLPVRAEQITVTKRTVVVEEVRIGRRPLEDVAHVRATVRREELDVDTAGDVDVRRDGDVITVGPDVDRAEVERADIDRANLDRAHIDRS